MALLLYADECVDARIVAGLRRRGVDVVAAADAGLLGLVLANRWATDRIPFPGLIFIQQKAMIGAVIRRDLWRVWFSAATRTSGAVARRSLA